MVVVRAGTKWVIHRDPSLRQRVVCDGIAAAGSSHRPSAVVLLLRVDIVEAWTVVLGGNTSIIIGLGFHGTQFLISSTVVDIVHHVRILASNTPPRKGVSTYTHNMARAAGHHGVLLGGLGSKGLCKSLGRWGVVRPTSNCAHQGHLA